MNRLKHFRQRLGLSASEFARRVGAQQPEIWRLERWPEQGGRKMTREWADRLAPALGVSPLQLLYSDVDQMMGAAAPQRPLAEQDFTALYRETLPVIEDTVTLMCGLFQIPVESPEAVAALAGGLARFLARRTRAGPPSAKDIVRLKRELRLIPPETTPAKPRPQK